MKKECIALSLSLCMLLSACSRQPDPRYADYTQSDLLELEEHSLFPFGEDMCLCGHREGYHSIHFALDEFSGNGKTAEDFISEKNSDSEDFNIVEFVKFADISKGSYKAYIDKYYPSDSVELADMDIIYCGDETRACLKIEEVPDFCSKMVSFKEKTARQTDVCRGFLT